MRELDFLFLLSEGIKYSVSTEFEKENWECEGYNVDKFKVTYGLTDLFKAADRRLGLKKIEQWQQKIDNPSVEKILWIRQFCSLKKVKSNFLVTEKDAEIFFNELVNPSKPNQAAIEAVERYRRS